MLRRLVRCGVAVRPSCQLGTNSWSSRWIPSHSPHRGRSPGIGTGRMISRTWPRRQKRKPRSAIQRRACDGSAWNWNGPGLIVGDEVQSVGTSVATMSRMLSRHGVPSMTSRQPSHRIAVFSLTIVGIRTPMISMPFDRSRRPAMGDKADFETKLVQTERGHVRAMLPFDPRERWGRKPRHYVVGTVAGRAFSGSVGFAAGGAFLVLSSAFRDAAGIKRGDPVHVAMGADARAWGGPPLRALNRRHDRARPDEHPGGDHEERD